MKKNKKLSLRKINIATIHKNISGGLNNASRNISVCDCVSLPPEYCRTKRANISVIVVGGTCQNEECR